MLRVFSVTFNVVAMLGLLLAGVVIHAQQRDWDVSLAWSLVLGCVWAAILIRVVVLLREAFDEMRRDNDPGHGHRPAQERETVSVRGGGAPE